MLKSASFLFTAQTALKKKKASVWVVNVLFVFWQLIIIYLALDLRLSDDWVSNNSLEQALN